MNLFFTCLSTFFIVYLGFLVYLHESRSKTSLFFLIHALCNFGWLICSYLALTVDPTKSVYFIRLVMFFAAPMIFSFFLFVYNFPEAKLVIKKTALATLCIWGGSLMVLALTPLVFKEVLVVNGLPLPQIGGLMPYYGLSIIGVTLMTFYFIIKKYEASDGLRKKQWRAISIGLTLTSVFTLSFLYLAIVLFNNSSLTIYSPLYILPTIIGAAYAILRHKLLNIKIITTEIAAFFLLFTSLWQILLAKDLTGLISQSAIGLLILVFSIFLIKSVLAEVRQREQLEVLTKQLEDANEKLKILDQARAEFITIASHQLRTPPATIKWYLSSILNGDYGRVTKELKIIIGKANLTNNSLISLIDDLLNVSRIERGKMEFLFEPCNLTDLAKFTYEQLLPIAQDKHLELVFDEPKIKLPEIMADKEKIRQVMNNLIDNAIKYTHDGKITVGISATADNIKFSVTDTGKGISPDEQGSIFEKYSRGKESVNQSPGLGLGLYVAKIVIGQHKGKIWAESPGPGKGSSFIFEIPIHNNLEKTTLLNLADK